MITLRKHSWYGLTYLDDTADCIEAYRGHLGVDMFHSHIAALAVARGMNKRAGRKVKKVVVAKQHFMVVDVK